MPLRVACVQAEPVILDGPASLDKALHLAEEAATAGARLIAFPETFVPCYAHWTHSARFEDPIHKRLHARLARNSVRVPEDLGALERLCREHDVAVALPVTERVDDTPGTLWNTMAVFGPDGYVGKHRKLVATHHERIVYHAGGGDTMRAFEVVLDGERVRFGGLLCWNNYMPLARAALYKQGIQVYLAPTADDRAVFQDTLRFIAQEGRVFVVSPSLVQRKSSFPADFELADTHAWREEEDEWNERGGSAILAPDGSYLHEPVYEDERILYADLDLDEVVAARQTFDPMGHYGATDVLELKVRGLDDKL